MIHCTAPTDTADNVDAVRVGIRSVNFFSRVLITPYNNRIVVTPQQQNVLIPTAQDMLFNGQIVIWICTLKAV